MSILETLANELGVDSRSLADNLTAGPNESLNATYLTVDPVTGLVTALIVGSVQLPEGAQGSVRSSLQWVDVNGILREYITGNSANAAGTIVHNILAVANPDTNDIAELLIRATEGGANTAEIAVFCKDSATNKQQSVLILDSLGNSNFPQLLTPQKAFLTFGTIVITWPGGTPLSSIATTAVLFPTSTLNGIATGGDNVIAMIESFAGAALGVRGRTADGSSPGAGQQATIYFEAVGN